MTPTSPTHAAALEYALRGMHVHPLRPGMKEPATTNGYHDATTDRAQIDAWWTQNPSYNVGIAVGPSGLAVLDVDVAQRKDGTWKTGRKSLGEIEHELTPTLLAHTGRVGQDGQPGMHAVYARPEGVPAQRIIGFREDLDLIGDGYIVVAPSFLAESGRYYEWAQQQAIAPLPLFLQTVARTPKVQATVELVGTPIPEGGRNNAMFRLGCALRDTGIGAEALARALDAENRQRFNPPLPDSELAVLVNSVLTTVQVRRDVALNATVAEDIKAMFAPAGRSEWIENVSLKPQPPVLFYSTGIPELDECMGGGFGTRMVAGLIAPPSTGKSALVGNWLALLSTQRPVLHCSLELTRHELFIRYAALAREFPWIDGIKGKIPAELMAAAVRGMRIKIFGGEDLDRNNPFASIRAEAERMAQECGIAPIIAIDYIQLMARGVGTETRSKVGELSMQTRMMAQDLDTVVIAVLTTQRQSYGNAKGIEAMRAANDPTAYLAAAKESGDVEFDFATLLYLDVDKLTEGPTKPGRIAVARCRVGHEGFIGIRARLDIGRFTADPSALGEFASEERAAKRDEQNMDLAKQKLLEAIAEMPGRPWRDLQAKVASVRGLQRTTVDRARDALIGEGVIEKAVRYDENRRKIPGEALVIKSPPSTVAATEDHHEDPS